MKIKKNENKFTVFIFLTFLCIFDSFSAAVKHVSPIEGIDWTFETTMGFQTLNNSIMSKESNSASINCPALTDGSPACAARIFCVIVIPIR